MKLYLKTMLLITLLLGVLSCGKKEETKEQPQTAVSLHLLQSKGYRDPHGSSREHRHLLPVLP